MKYNNTQNIYTSCYKWSVAIAGSTSHFFSGRIVDPTVTAIIIDEQILSLARPSELINKFKLCKTPSKTPYNKPRITPLEFLFYKTFISLPA